MAACTLCQSGCQTFSTGTHFLCCSFLYCIDKSDLYVMCLYLVAEAT